MAVQQKTSPKRQSRLRRSLKVANIVALIGLSFSTAFFAYKYYDLRSEVNLTQEQKNERLVQEVGKVYTLPGEEKPVVAIVSDEQKFKEEYQVFPNAKKDDYLLLYEKAGLAILYRPSEKKVIATAPLSVRDEISIALIGPEAGTADIEKKLEEQVGEQTKVVSKTAGNQAYASTVVVDVKGGQETVAAQLAQISGGTVGSLPEGEKAPEGVNFVIVIATPQSEPVADPLAE